MADSLCISATFLDPQFHGQADGGDAEWPPSPLRLFQALIAVSADEIAEASDLTKALTWLEQQPPPTIVAPRVRKGAPYRLSVPNNAMDVVARSWSRGKYFGSGDASPATHKTMKTVSPQCLLEDETVRYLWPLDSQSRPEDRLLAALTAAARRLVALGWGIDLVVGHAQVTSQESLDAPTTETWRSTKLAANTALRVPISGTLAALKSRHQAFLQRIDNQGLLPPDAFTQFDKVAYRRASDPPQLPCAAFELLTEKGAWSAYPQRKMMKMAGMVRHLAIQAMKQSPPYGCDEQWVERYVAGHAGKSKSQHRQFSYIPLPSIGHKHGDQLIRRVLITAPAGDEQWLRHLAERLHGELLKPEKECEFEEGQIPRLLKIPGDSVTRCYTRASNTWNSVTPVILPGHDDHKAAKTQKLIEKALADSGIVQPCQYEWNAVSRFPKSFSAHKTDRNKRPTGYLRPDHLLSQTAVHLTLRFHDSEQAGPLVIGAGRHYGFGLMANALTDT